MMPALCWPIGRRELRMGLTMPGTPPPLKTFAEGTASFPVPIPSGSLAVTAPATSRSVMLTPVPKSGFVSLLRFNATGTLNVTTAAATQYNVPLWRLIQNYTLQNSLNYPYRSLNGDDIHEWARITGGVGSQDPITGSLTYENPTVTAIANNVPFAFGWTDHIGQNSGINFSRYLLSALNTSNDLTIVITFLPIGSLAALQQGTAVIGSYSCAIQVSVEYFTVPKPTEYMWPARNIVQQVLGDPSFTNVVQGENDVNITPISGPEFTGLGIQALAAGGALDPMTPAGGFISEVDLYVDGTIPIKQYKFADLVWRYEELFGRSPAGGYIVLDLMSDLSLPNVMSHIHRKVMSTSKYSQITAKVFTTANYTLGAGAKINLLKRTQQKYANNR